MGPLRLLALSRRTTLRGVPHRFLPGGPRRARDAGADRSERAVLSRGPAAPIPQDLPQYSYRLRVPAGIRKREPWTIALSGLTSAQPVANQFFLDRQCHLSIFHEKLGLIVSGANSKRQPELATFRETVRGRTSHLPISTALRMEPGLDRLSLAYNTFFADLEVPEPSRQQVT